jgi:hypothetical protein
MVTQALRLTFESAAGPRDAVDQLDAQAVGASSAHPDASERLRVQVRSR